MFPRCWLRTRHKNIIGDAIVIVVVAVVAIVVVVVVVIIAVVVVVVVVVVVANAGGQFDNYWVNAAPSAFLC